MKVVVTGGAGFIGSNLSRALLSDHEVHIIDDLSTGDRDNVPADATFHGGSILDDVLLSQVVEGAQVIFHQAARPSVPRSIKDPIASHEVNATGTLRVLEAARHNDVEKVVYAGSSSAYGDTPTLPKQEGMPTHPKSPYAVAKLAGEHYCAAYHEVYGLATSTLRYFNVYGPRQDPSGGYAAAIPAFVSAALAGRPLQIHGDGAQTRDFTFVADAVQANIKAAKPGPSDGQVMNVGGGTRISVLDLARQIVAGTGSSSEIVHTDPRPGDVRDSLADITLARKWIGYEPTTPLAEGLRQTIGWFQNHLPTVETR